VQKNWEMFLRLATMGLSRDTFYRYQEAVDADGVDALLKSQFRHGFIKKNMHARVLFKSVNGVEGETVLR